MCYHTANPNKKEIIDDLPKMNVLVDFEKYYHVSGFTRPYLPITANDAQNDVIAAQWKLLPFWVKTEADAKKYANTLNAESESIFEKASYKPYIKKHRGLLWVNGFFEPHKNEKTGAPENYFIHDPAKNIFSLGIVIAPWTNQDTGEIVQTFSIITTKANPLLEEIHNEKKRMPLVIGENERDAWLNAEGVEDIKELMVPYAGELSGRKIAHRVTADRTGDTNRPDIQK